MNFTTGHGQRFQWCDQPRQIQKCMGFSCSKYHDVLVYFCGARNIFFYCAAQRDGGTKREGQREKERKRENQRNKNVYVVCQTMFKCVLYTTNADEMRCWHLFLRRWMQMGLCEKEMTLGRTSPPNCSTVFDTLFRFRWLSIELVWVCINLFLSRSSDFVL